MSLDYHLLADSEDNGLYITYILKLCSVIVMVTPVTVEDKFQQDGDLIYAGEYLDIARNSQWRLHEETKSQTTYLSSLQVEI